MTLLISNSDPNQQYYGGQPGYPPQQQPGYPPPQGYPGGYPPQGPPGAYPQPGGYPPVIPIHGYPQPGYPQPGYGGAGGDFQPGFVPPHMPPQGNGAGYDPEDPEVKGFDFTEESVRKGFIRKVYSILCVSIMHERCLLNLFIYDFIINTKYIICIFLMISPFV